MRGSPVALTRSAYVDGETWLALAHYHDTFPDDVDVERALGSLEDYVLDHYLGEGRDAKFFHWGAMASAVRQRTTNDPRFAEFAAALAAWYLDEVPFETKREQTTCSVIEGTASILAALGDRPAGDALAARCASGGAGARAQPRAPDRAGPAAHGPRGRRAAGGPGLAATAGAFLAGTTTRTCARTSPSTASRGF